MQEKAGSGRISYLLFFYSRLDSRWDKEWLRKRGPLFSFGQPRQKREPTLESSFLFEGTRGQRDLLLDYFHLEQKASIDGSATIDGPRRLSDDFTGSRR